MRSRWLIAIDLDGTLLSNSVTNEVNDIDKQAIQDLIDAGHIVSIITGRGYNSCQEVYQKIGLRSIIGNYNGAYIHNPTDIHFQSISKKMNLTNMFRILNDKKLQKEKSNTIICGLDWAVVEKKDTKLERVFGFNALNMYIKGINYGRLFRSPISVMIDTKKDTDITKLKDYLSRTYAGIVEFSSWGKGEGESSILDFTNTGVNKGVALSSIARSYKININKTVAIGDNFNDIPMFKVAEISAAVGNSSNEIKDTATYVCEKTNKTGAIAEFVNHFLGEDRNNFIAKQRRIREKMNKIAEHITKASDD